MQKLVSWLFALVPATSILFSPLTSVASDFKRDVAYQIITDRFVDGNPANNNPKQSAGMFDGTKSNWRAYWGGDLRGIRQKLPYLAGLGITAIWISPPVDNLNAVINDSSGNPTASYHGYQGRDFKRIEEHFGDDLNSWADFDALVTAAHQNGIKVIVDFAPNHSTQDNAGEFGALYDNGLLVGKFSSDNNGYFNHNGNISGGGWDDRYQVQYQTLFNLADLNQENATIDAYLKAAAQLFQQHGADGFRIDATKHTNWGWQYSLANSIHTYGDSFVFGEWYQGTTADPLYRDSCKFANKSGISLLDFPLNTAIRNVFGFNANFSEIDSVISQEANDFIRDEELVTFLDNHDMARLLSINKNNHRLHQALSFILTARGIPSIYYGTEQYLHNDTSGGTDPYNRPMMTSFATDTVAYKLTNKLSNLRRKNPAIAFGSTTRRWLSNDVYIYERKFFGNVALVAINKSDASTFNITSLTTALPAGMHTNYLAGLINGASINVGTGTGDKEVSAFSLPPHSVSVWQYTEQSNTPHLGSLGPSLGQHGVKVTLSGQDFGTAKGTVKFGTTLAPVVSWSPTQIVVTTPSVPSGNHDVTVNSPSGRVSNALSYTVLAAKLIPVTFTVNNAGQTQVGDYIFLTGNTVELGNWSTTWDGAVGPMLAPNYPNRFLTASVPAGKTIQFKFIKISASGAVTWEAGANHSFIVPTNGVGSVKVNWQY